MALGIHLERPIATHLHFPSLFRCPNAGSKKRFWSLGSVGENTASGGGWASARPLCPLRNPHASEWVPATPSGRVCTASLLAPGDNGRPSTRLITGSTAYSSLPSRHTTCPPTIVGLLQKKPGWRRTSRAARKLGSVIGPKHRRLNFSSTVPRVGELHAKKPDRSRASHVEDIRAKSVLIR